ncbi:FadR family transcriptional regulator [Arsenicicoccus piscis]|uniref:Transcriptional regulator n=1 Tax=Arsenicicoccus piscis TaxID=673954 RepID=A0ABQ6HM56_9MICO|nr:FadR/GntR family transcriptional regulator [Arsenicicoccus piscis]MCH8626912.1 FadR family transcriptional regulator [Arsenicicoccus piscis]GMA19173.1 transcriptional regulator [Arsenicicoccus piscis]
MKTTVEQSLRAYLDDKTANGELGPGSRLPTERALVAQLDAPRSAVRRALDTLEGEGVVTRHVGRGTFLTESARAGAEAAPPDTSPVEIMQVRLVIEPPVAMLAARLATQADLDRIVECLQAGGASSTFEDFEAWDAKLHRAIAHAAHNGLLLSMFDVMNTARTLPVWGTLKRRTSTPERRGCYHQEHEAIVGALVDRDPEKAERTMRVHLEHVADNLLGRV